MSTTNTIEIFPSLSLEGILQAAEAGLPWALYMKIKATFKDQECYKFWSICGVGTNEPIQSHHGKVGCKGVYNLHNFANLTSIVKQKQKIVSSTGDMYLVDPTVPVHFHHNTEHFHNHEKFWNDLKEKKRKKKERESIVLPPVEKVEITEPVAPVVPIETAAELLPEPPPKPLVDPSLEGRSRLKALMRKRRRTSDW